MNKERVISELKSCYPDKNIIQLPLENPQEIICEVEPATEHPEKSIAIAVIDNSSPHLHKKSTETYEVLRGEVALYVGDKVQILTPGENYVIEPGNVHWAKGDETWVKVTSNPGWTPEDQILVDNQ